MKNRKDENEKNDEDEKFTTTGVIKEISIHDVLHFYDKDVSEVVFVGRYLIPPDVEYDLTPEEASDRYMLRLALDIESMNLKLPENPPACLLRAIEKDFPEGFHISDPTAKTISFVTIGGCMSDSDKLFGLLEFCKNTDTINYKVNYIYCDKPVTITGTGKDWWKNHLTYDLTLKKGWNMVVEKSEDTDELYRHKTINNLLPEGMMWYYDVLAIK